jgi:two-component system chemotaxis response regulator CheY
MPIMDGLKLVKRVRTDRTTKHAQTPDHHHHHRGLARRTASARWQLGANAYITKPIQAPQVIAKVKELLKIE